MQIEKLKEIATKIFCIYIVGAPMLFFMVKSMVDRVLMTRLST